METAPLDSQDELTALRALVAEQAAKLESQEAEVIKRDSIIGLLRAQTGASPTSAAWRVFGKDRPEDRAIRADAGGDRGLPGRG